MALIIGSLIDIWTLKNTHTSEFQWAFSLTVLFIPVSVDVFRRMFVP